MFQAEEQQAANIEVSERRLRVLGGSTEPEKQEVRLGITASSPEDSPLVTQAFPPLREAWDKTPASRLKYH